MIAVVIPTYNEADNIKKLIQSVKSHTDRQDKIIIVDDNSPDGTGQIVTKLAAKMKNLEVVHRKGKGGRGSAVLAGFWAAQKFSPDYFIEMDADFSHKPKDLPRLKQAIGREGDVVIGSRYLAKSRIYNWPLTRRIFSKLSNFYARFVLNVPISDYTNGFRIYSQKAMDFLLSQKHQSRGYILLSETAYKLHRAGFKFGQIPIVFVNRKRGVSNLNVSEIKNAFWQVLKIRFPHLPFPGR